MPLDRWSVGLIVRNWSCDVMGMKSGQSYPILDAYLGEFEIDTVGFKQGITPWNFPCFEL